MVGAGVPVDGIVLGTGPVPPKLVTNSGETAKLLHTLYLKQSLQKKFQELNARLMLLNNLTCGLVIILWTSGF